MLPKNLNKTMIMDEAHGWLRVSEEEIRELGIGKEISTFSYQNGRLYI